MNRESKAPVSPGCGRSGRTVVAAVAVLLILLAGIAVYIINRAPDTTIVESGPGAAATGPSTAAPTAAARPSIAPPQSPLFEGWDAPAAVLVFTGELRGQLEPCGCTAGQVGGLSRRVDLVRQLSEVRNWPVAAFDIGGSLRDERAKRPQEAIKFKTFRSAQRLMNYDAQAIGAEELRLGADKLFELFSEEESAGDPRPAFVCANVTLFQERTDTYSTDMPLPEQFRVVEVGGLRIAVTAIVGDDSWAKVFPAGATIDSTLYAFEPVQTALARVVPLMQEQEPDLLVLLSHAELDASREIAAQFPAFDAVVTAGGPEDGRRKPGLVNDTLILEVGQRGKAVGVIGIFPQAEQKLKFELVELNGSRFEHAPSMNELFKAYVQQLNDQHPALQENLGPHPSGATYVGADACAECHQSEFDTWRNSKHSHGFESLTKGRPDTEDDEIFVVRIHDPECITCHATGWDPEKFARFDSAFVDLETTPLLAGSQCENCHGPASVHVELERALRQAGGDPGDAALAARTAQHLDVDVARTSLCIKCHDGDNSPTFDSADRPFEDWWAEIAH